MLYNIKPLHLHCVFHGIRFKVNKDWLSGIDSLLFYIYLPTLLFPTIYSFSHLHLVHNQRKTLYLQLY